MKEYNRVDFEDDDYNNLDDEKFNEISGFNQNKIISPLVSNQNSPNQHYHYHFDKESGYCL